MTTKRKQFQDYDTEGERKIALRIYVNKGEQDIIDEAIRVTERSPNRSSWAAKVILTEACRIIGIEYPYKS